ncbi:tetratricopeptide repeat protein [Marivirga sp. S37H4]|uniref:Tetratricopeptide repeat protein n=1 Tax=Marivirga aurantiaca TaxID=2802615 RepID=A0A935C680_9BACT|nr:tetratricopeptide repeat protein [Marivirga aurantiaca]MBK6263577.1 tetratricopeptide repeat protein [Marivirga aurantiaca]
MKNNILKFALMLVVFNMILTGVKAQVKTTMYKAYLTNSEALWKQAFNQASSGNNPEQLAHAYYGLLNNAMASKNEELFDFHIDKAIEYLEKLEEQNTHKAEAMALRSSLYGFIMGFSPWKGMYYGPKSGSAIEGALKLDKESGIVWMVKAFSLLYTPEAFGGNKLQAEKAFEKSISTFEMKGDTISNWLYLNTLAGLGQTYLANEKKKEAIATYNKALAIEPEFTWVSKVLLLKASK